MSEINKNYNKRKTKPTDKRGVVNRTAPSNRSSANLTKRKDQYPRLRLKGRLFPPKQDDALQLLVARLVLRQVLLHAAQIHPLHVLILMQQKLVDPILMAGVRKRKLNLV